ncbi:acyltransferase family protein [Herbaspirillum sp. alder98]|uniref:acyltransferase family protein n=1 Tax=Herbaspirillum sp. alder98 TaxID=2913096 RepID=UPI001CD831DC|nr:acyltransferase [Herbaspirillum sp. alder98]MCA1322653.1 acyltransferase [Herbaspirillum sp. alder98]
MMPLQHAELKPGIAQPESTTAPAPKKTALRIHELDGLRGLLALMVVCYHLYGSLQSVRDLLHDKLVILTQAWYAVDVFFLMSGFVMMHVYGRTFSEGAGVKSFFKFMWARVARLYPVHVFAMTAMLLIMLPVLYREPELYAWQGRYSLGAYFGSLLMLHGPWMDYRSWNYPAWSISAEWHAYLLFPLMVPLVARIGRVGAVLAVIACTLIPLALYLQNLQPDQYPTNGVLVLLRVFPLFLAGTLMYRIGAANWFSSGFAAALLVLATVVALSHEQWAPWAVLLAPAMVLSALSQNWFQSVLRRPLLLFFGKISYSMYMTHALVETMIVLICRVARRYFQLDIAADINLAFPLWASGIVLAVVVGYFVWRWVEEPARKWVMGLKT